MAHNINYTHWSTNTCIQLNHALKTVMQLLRCERPVAIVEKANKIIQPDVNNYFTLVRTTDHHPTKF